MSASSDLGRRAGLSGGCPCSGSSGAAPGQCGQDCHFSSTHLKLFEAAILVHDVQHGDLEAVQPLLEVGHLVLEGVQVLLGHGLLQPGVAVAIGAVDLESQAL